MKTWILIASIIALSIVSVLTILLDRATYKEDKAFLYGVLSENIELISSYSESMAFRIEAAHAENPCGVEQVYRIYKKTRSSSEYLIHAIDRLLQEQDVSFPTDSLQKMLDAVLNDFQRIDKSPYQGKTVTGQIRESKSYRVLMDVIRNGDVEGYDKTDLNFTKIMIIAFNNLITKNCLQQIAFAEAPFIRPVIHLDRSNRREVKGQYYVGDVYLGQEVVQQDSRAIVAKGFDSINNQLVDVIDTIPIEDGSSALYLNRKILNQGKNQFFIMYQLPRPNPCKKYDKYQNYFKMIMFNYDSEERKCTTN